ncbi:MAG TPA: hypothetical protein VI997_11225, partial [Candidatus Thermoplasmatota archaeon]|nr:hypothetical protein [Candidatus Thermoplasmatota archaeon]
MRAAFVVLPVFSLVLAGCAEKVSDITGGDDREERTAGATPEARALNALAAVGDDMGADGEIRKMTMVATGGGYSGTVILVLGADDRSSLSMDASGFSFRLVCSDETGVLTLSDRSYEARAGAFCEDGRFITEDESQDPFGTVTFEENENVKIVSVTRLPGGGSRIELEVRADADESGDADVEGADEDETPPGGGDVDGSDEDAAEDFAMSYVVYTDSKNRVVNMSMDAPQGGGRYEATFEYGKRGTIDVPSADARIPARVEHDDEFDAGTYSWEVDEAE